MASSGLNTATGGSTPKASAVKKIMFCGCGPTEGITAFGM